MMFDIALQGAAPPWAAFLAARRSTIDWIAAPPLPSGVHIEPFMIKTDVRGGVIVVGERVPGARLPLQCPELHVNTDSSFCMERKIHRIADPVDVGAFWQHLGEYLVNQHYAARRGHWPAGRWLSHGPKAADLQMRAEAAALSVGFETEYADCLENDDGWIADLVRGGIGPDVPCRRGCRDGDGPVLPLAKCIHRNALDRIATAERARRAAQDGYFSALRRRGLTCCGRVGGCPLERRTS